MSWGMVAGAAISVVGGIASSNAQKKAANRSSDAQVAAAEVGAEEQRAARESLQKLLAPYVDAGNGALAGQQALLGLSGAEKQQAAIAGIEGSPQFTSLMQQGENAILQNASATGGLRGGNTQDALSQFRPQLLNQLIQQQYQNLGGLTSIGQNAAAGVGNAGMQSANAISNLYQQQGAAQAGAFLANGRANAQMYGDISKTIGSFIGSKF